MSEGRVESELFWRESAVRSVVMAGVFSWFLLLGIHIIGVKRIPLMDGVVDEAVLPLKRFTLDSWRFLHRCSKPSRKEFTKIAFATGIGFCLMGFLGFFVKLVHIPINNIIVS